MGTPLLLSYANCSTCKKAIAWLAARGIAVDVKELNRGTLKEISTFTAKVL